MLKKILIPVILLMGLACVAYMVIAAHRSEQTHGPKQVTLPPGYGSIKTGMSESQVVSLVGQPDQKSQYAKYEKKPPEYWITLQKQVDAASGGASASYAAPSMATIRAATELTHQYRDVWLYKPVPSMIMTLYFSDQGVLLNMGTASGGSKGAPGPGSRSPVSRG